MLGAAPREAGRGKVLARSYDYVIVGAGSAGCVVARRLVDGTDATILLLEAGGTDEGVKSISNPPQWLENIGSRYDWVQDPNNAGRTLNAGSVYLEWYPSEFSKLNAGYEAFKAEGRTVVNRILVQAVFSLGPHKPHPF